MSIPFTQYLHPNGRKNPVKVDRPENIEVLVHKGLVSEGFENAEEKTENPEA